MVDRGAGVSRIGQVDRLLLHEDLVGLYLDPADGFHSEGTLAELDDVANAQASNPETDVALGAVHCVVDAEDMLQEGFIKVFSQIHTFENRGAFEGWIRRIVVHTCINILKKNKKFKWFIRFNWFIYTSRNCIFNNPKFCCVILSN